MKQNRTKIGLMLLALIPILEITANSASGAVALGHIADNISGLGRRPYGDVLQAYLRIHPLPVNGIPVDSILLGPFPITDGNVNREIWPSDDPDDWTAFMQHLTNGFNESLYLGHATYTSGGPSANVGRFEGPHPTMASWGLGEPDLSGFTIEFIRLEATGYSAVGKHYSYQRWEFWGSPVPEPATLSLLALGGLVLIKRKRN